MWRQANKYHVPRIAFINKLDREGADFESVFAEIENRLHARPVAVQIPVGQGPPHVAQPFRGVIDLVTMKFLTFPEGKDGNKIIKADIPEDMADEAQLWREKLLESLYDYSNELMELRSPRSRFPRRPFTKSCAARRFICRFSPVLCGSALHGMGVQPILNAVAAYLPCPLDMPPVEGIDVGTKHHKGKAAADETAKKIQRKPDPKEPFCGLVFKVLPYKTGDLAWVRIYSGTLEPNSRVLNPGQDKKENVAQLWRIHASKKEEQIDEARAGDIVGVIGCATRSRATRSATLASRFCSSRSNSRKR